MKKLVAIAVLACLSFSIHAQTVSDNRPDISDFSYFCASYYAPFQAPEYGAYGVGGEAFGHRGFGFSLYLGANFGILDPASMTFLIGPTYGYAVSNHFAVSCPLELGAGFTTASYGQKSDWFFAWRLVPKAVLRFGKLSVIGGFPVSYSFSVNRISCCWMAGIGIDI